MSSDGDVELFDRLVIDALPEDQRPFQTADKTQNVLFKKKKKFQKSIQPVNDDMPRRNLPNWVPVERNTQRWNKLRPGRHRGLESAAKEQNLSLSTVDQTKISTKIS